MGVFLGGKGEEDYCKEVRTVFFVRREKREKFVFLRRTRKGGRERLRPPPSHSKRRRCRWHPRSSHFSICRSFGQFFHFVVHDQI